MFKLSSTQTLVLTNSNPSKFRFRSRRLSRLADAILARAEEAEETIDKELEEMDRQLKLQVGSLGLWYYMYL